MNRLAFRMLIVMALAGSAAFMATAQPQGVVPAAVKQSDLDQPLAWLAEAKRNYGEVKDYTCHLFSQERVGGKLQDKSIMILKMKTEPFSVYMKWLEPEKSKGQEVVFVQGKNNNKMKVKSNVLGQGKILGWIAIDPNDERVTQHSRHTILEAGIGNMIDQHIRQWETDRRIGKTKVNVQPFVWIDRKCVRIELTRTEKDPAFYCYRTVIFLEQESKMPILLENYDWPTNGGPQEGELLEKFGYVNLRFNTGLKDAEFNK